MPLSSRIPHGRAGRLWLRHRLATAERGRDQLDRKLRVLLPERQRIGAEAQRRRTEWSDACANARTWLLRAALLGGQDALRGAAAADPVEVEITWTTSMGLSYPDSATIASPSPEPPQASNSAIPPATSAVRDALAAGARTAAAEEALRRLDTEIALTRRRVRALDKRWLPWLRTSLAELDLTLQQAEQEDAARLRRAAP